MAVTKNSASAASKADTPKNAEVLAPATEFDASGAIIEPAIIERVDMAHPSVDSTPRERSTPEMNAIDFNVPSALESQEDAVARNLREQGA